MKKALCFFMAVLFVCCVMCYEKDERFSVEVMITNITKFDDIPTMQDIMDVWSLDYYIEITYEYHYPTDEYGNILSGPPITEAIENRIYYEDYEGTNEILLFFERVGVFFNRVFRTIKIIVDIFVKIFGNLKYLLPWNNTVPRGQW